MWKEMMGVVRSALQSTKTKNEKKQPQVSKQQQKEEVKVPPKKSSKFSKRFTLRAGRSQKPNQWIHPPILLLEVLESKTVEQLLTQVNKKQRQVMANQLQAWRVSICDLLRSLHLQNPDDGSIVAEINYWRDMARILEALDVELQAPYVFKIVNILRIEPSSEQSEILKDYEVEIRKVGRGLKEASWNYKYMKILEASAMKIENKYSKLMDTEIVITSVLKTIKNIFENSNFYKEARIVSLLDRVLSSIITKLKIYFDFARFFIKSKEELEQTIEDFDSANRLVQKLAKGMWIREWIGVTQTELDPFRSTKTLDFLNFQRPGTAMRKTHLNFQTAGNPVSRPPSVFGSTQTSSFQSTQSSFSLTKSVKPLNSNHKKAQDRPIWYERAEKIIRQSDHLPKVLQNLQFIASSLNQMRGEWLSTSQDLNLRCYRELKEFLYFYESKAPLIDYDPLLVGNKYIFESFMVRLVKEVRKGMKSGLSRCEIILKNSGRDMLSRRVGSRSDLRQATHSVNSQSRVKMRFLKK